MKAHEEVDRTEANREILYCFTIFGKIVEILINVPLASSLVYA